MYLACCWLILDTCKLYFTVYCSYPKSVHINCKLLITLYVYYLCCKLYLTAYDYYLKSVIYYKRLICPLFSSPFSSSFSLFTVSCWVAINFALLLIVMQKFSRSVSHVRLVECLFMFNLYKEIFFICSSKNLVDL